MRRPVRANSAFAQRLLYHLEAQGFNAAPRFLGIDAFDREMLSFLRGDVPDELGDYSLTQIAHAAHAAWLWLRLGDADLAAVKR